MECFKGNINIKEQKYDEAVSIRNIQVPVKTTILKSRYAN